MCLFGTIPLHRACRATDYVFVIACDGWLGGSVGSFLHHVLYIFTLWGGESVQKMHLGTAFFSDQRIALLSEVICGIRVIKMNVWEEVFEKLLGNSRRFVSRILSIYN